MTTQETVLWGLVLLASIVGFCGPDLIKAWRGK